MKILVTSGGTSEAIDSVRSITNHSTGHLGKIITETLLSAGHEVCLITTKRALKPEPHPPKYIKEIQYQGPSNRNARTCVQDKGLDHHNGCF